MKNLTETQLYAEGRYAFPARHTPEHSPGMTLRDWFAGQAMAGAAYNFANGQADAAAEKAYRFADAMLAARERPGRQ